MAIVSYANLKLKVQDEIKTFNFHEQNIEVKQYLPINDKYDLVMITLQKALEGNIYNELKLDMYFQLHLVYMYSNLSFTEKQKEDESKLYDILMTNGFFDKFLFEKVFNQDEYNTLLGYIEMQKEDELHYNTTAAAIIKTIVRDLPAQAEAVKDIVDNFDPDKYEAVKQFAEAANGGRPIPARTE